jgi:Uma2 family endonuclease
MADVVFPHISEYEDVIATDVSEADYLARYAHDYCEWIDGVVIKMSGATITHNLILWHFFALFSSYFVLRPLGQVIPAPFVLRMRELGRSREPDVLVILNENPGVLTDTHFTGAPDVIIEVISPESVGRDRGDKFAEYEKIGVREYWMFDYVREEALFYRRDAHGNFRSQPLTAAGEYVSDLFPALRIETFPLWEGKFPHPGAVFEMVQRMVADDGA